MFFGLLEDKMLQDERLMEYHISVPGVGLFGVAPPILKFWAQLAVVRSCFFNGLPKEPRSLFLRIPVCAFVYKVYIYRIVFELCFCSDNMARCCKAPIILHRFPCDLRYCGAIDIDVAQLPRYHLRNSECCTFNTLDCATGSQYSTVF